MLAVSYSTVNPSVQAELPRTLLLAGLFLMILLALAGGVIIWVGRWSKKPPAAARSSGDDLAHFRLLYEQGEFSREEYERIRAKLVPRLRKELDLPAPKTADAPPAEGQADDRIQATRDDRADAPPAREQVDDRIQEAVPPPAPPPALDGPGT